MSFTNLKPIAYQNIRRSERILKEEKEADDLSILSISSKAIRNQIEVYRDSSYGLENLIPAVITKKLTFPISVALENESVMHFHKLAVIMTERWRGCTLSVECTLGTIEGLVSSVDASNQTLTLIEVVKNGAEYVTPEITINARDIRGIKILKAAEEKWKGAAVQQSKSSAFVAPESLTNKCRESPVKSDDALRKKSGEARKKVSTPKKNENRKWYMERDEECFNVPIDNSILENDFDFEKNLALFDKQAIFDEINAHTKGDSVRLVDCNRREQRYRCDENVLEGETFVSNQISVPCNVDRIFVTDTGLVIPSISKELKEKLLKVAEEFGLAIERRLEMVGRATTEMVLQLLGGSHRLSPQNSHQRPTVVILCGLHTQGAQGINCGRHLANHGVNVTVLVPPTSSKNECFSKELTLFALTNGKKTSSVLDMPSTVDIIIGALDGYERPPPSEHFWYSAAVQWALQCKAPVLCLDCPPEGSCLEPKWMLVSIMPFAFNDHCSLYLCDIGLPKEVFKKVGVNYTSPFGSKFIIPLYLKST
ncbi:enhancer of mRNA-decapping protein 3-like isoform X2 [Centruroides sculpturatus]|uniref:enhancer of mRNA-decapping protein 3-like isoform X2 n=1 Tax=Centruroides sculpturatus TaxID=218467 RepID=UPI000C6CA7F4|nr:enhancer of mRNA-decapping protein 3-like isoform X2 [Centruroides sculpturatus]